MRFLIVFLVIAAVVTGIIAYGPGRPGGDEPENGTRLEVEAEAAQAIEEEEEAEEVVQIDPLIVPQGEQIPGTDGLRLVTGSIQRTVNHTLAVSLEREVADPLTQVTNRMLVWWMDPRRDLRPGDDLRVVYSLHEAEEPRLHAVSLTSQRHRQTFRAYAFHREGDTYRRMYSADGKEVEKRLEDSPVRDYEQITSLLWDGRGHNGVDFKTPEGTEVFAPFNGRVTRKNWNTRFNGNCLQISADNGREVLFLHLQSIPDEIRPGTRVAIGDLVALSGNTGRSTAPHLHYEVRSSNGRVLDPFDLHETYRVEIPEAEMTSFAEAVSVFDSLLDAATPVAEAR